MSTAAQPGAKPPMAPSKSSEMQEIAKKAGTDYVRSAAKEAGKKTTDYEADNGQDQLDYGQQKLDDAKAQAQGMWAKYCGCFSA